MILFYDRIGIILLLYFNLQSSIFKSYCFILILYLFYSCCLFFYCIFCLFYLLFFYILLTVYLLSYFLSAIQLTYPMNIPIHLPIKLNSISHTPLHSINIFLSNIQPILIVIVIVIVNVIANVIVNVIDNTNLSVLFSVPSLILQYLPFLFILVNLYLKLFPINLFTYSICFNSFIIFILFFILIVVVVVVDLIF